MYIRIRQVSLFTAVATILAIGLGATAFAQGQGTWKLNVAKSTYHQGQAPKSTTLIYEAAGEGIKVTVDSVPAEGAPIHYAYAANYDGKDNPVKGDPGRDTAALKKIDDYTIEIVSKKAGKVVNTLRTVFSRDGKTRTGTAQGTNAQGQKFNNTQVYDK